MSMPVPVQRTSRPPSTAPLLAAAVVAALAVSLLAQPWYRLLHALWPAEAALADSAQFGSWLLLIAAVGWLVRRDDLGVRAGRVAECRPLLAGSALGLAAVTGVIVWLTGPNAWSDADWAFELIFVPVGEELVFRGLMLGVLVSALRRMRPQAQARRLALLYSAVAFGLAHLANAVAVDPLFVAGQAVFATALGWVLGAVRLRTDSVLPAIGLHAVVNGVNLIA